MEVINMVKKNNPRPLTKADLYTIINLRNQGLDMLEIGLLIGLSLDDIENGFYHADRLKSRLSVPV
jgi:hypothetical protein